MSYTVQFLSDPRRSHINTYGVTYLQISTTYTTLIPQISRDN